MRIFVAGATGEVGRKVVPLLIAGSHEVTAVGRTPEKRAMLKYLGATPVEVDLFEPDAIKTAVAGHDVVINVATSIPSTSRMFLPAAWHENDKIRRTASANLVDAAIASGAKRYIQESFALIYPDHGDEWIDESLPPEPTSYNHSVLDAEASADRFTQSGQTGVVLRFAAFYGTDPQTQDIIRFVQRGWAPLPGSADACFSAVSHDDAASAVIAALNVPAGIYNVVDDEPMDRREYFNALAQALGVAPPKLLPGWASKLFGPLGETLARSLRISNRKLRTTSGWSPKYPSVREGWRAVIAAVQQAA